MKKTILLLLVSCSIRAQKTKPTTTITDVIYMSTSVPTQDNYRLLYGKDIVITNCYTIQFKGNDNRKASISCDSAIVKTQGNRDEIIKELLQYVYQEENRMGKMRKEKDSIQLASWRLANSASDYYNSLLMYYDAGPENNKCAVKLLKELKKYGKGIISKSKKEK